MHNGDTFALDVVRDRYLGPGNKNPGPPKLTELLELYKDRGYDANIVSDAKTTSRQRFGGVSRRNNRGRDGGSGGNGDNFKNVGPGNEAAAPRASHLHQQVGRDQGL
eukprot:jgi/Tetstr1/440518/TSEL_028841.t1